MDKKTNNLSTCQLQTRQQNKTNNLSTRQLKTCQLKKDTSGGYCGGVPPLPIPNREVKPTCADGTAMQCGRVGSRLLLQSTLKIHFFRVLFLFIYLACGPPANPSTKGLVFPRMAEVVSRKVWCFRARRKSFPERFGISAHGESRFPNGLAFPRMAKVVSREVWCLRGSRKSLFKGFGACGPPANHFLKDFVLAGLPQITF